MQNDRPIPAWDTLLDLDEGVDADAHGTGGARAARVSLRTRLERVLRAAVTDGRLPAGAVLPPSRMLAETIGVSRWVVTEAYGQLVAEGVLDARTGSATRVAASAHPTSSLAQAEPPPDRSFPSGTPDVLSVPSPRFDLRPGIPDLRATPRSRWAAALRSALATLPDRDLAAPHPFGFPPTRIAVAEHLTRSRHAVAAPERVLLTHGASDGMSILATELHRRGHSTILVEDPSWPRLRDIATQAGLRPIPVPVDDEGVDVTRLAEAAARTGARAALLTPAHQFPLGAALSAARREQIVRWARDADALLIEDDYDAEFRYDRRPIAALQRLAPDRIALLGSLSKSVSPALGVGWALLPTGIDPLPSPSAPSLIDQAALAHFIMNGDLERHLRSSRIRFRRRRSRLLDALRTELPGLTPSGIAAGMHLLLPLPAGCAGADVVARATGELALTTRGRYTVDGVSPEALVLGYGNLDDTLVEEAVARLAALIRAATTPAS